jgi:hypothetical protein
MISSAMLSLLRYHYRSCLRIHWIIAQLCLYSCPDFETDFEIWDREREISPLESPLMLVHNQVFFGVNSKAALTG